MLLNMRAANGKKSIELESPAFDEEADRRWLWAMRKKSSVPHDARSYLDEGDAWTDEIARLSMPILLSNAPKGRSITYKELAEKIQVVFGVPLPKTFRNYGHPLGKIFRTIRFLWKDWGEPVPPINLLVVNGESGRPGDGAHLINEQYWAQAKDKRGKYLGNEGVLGDIYAYNWFKVADYLGIELLEKYKIEDRPVELPPPRDFAGPESIRHKELKLWIKQNPEFLAEGFGIFTSGTNEKLLRSGDRLDVHFSNRHTELAVEVKVQSGSEDYFEAECFRGIFQCVKYREILRAEQRASGRDANAKAALVYQGSFPKEAFRLAKLLVVPVIHVPKR